MLKVAVIGLGNMGKNHARVYCEHPESKLVAVCDTNKKIADLFSKKYKCNVYYSVDDLLDNENLDGVSIVVPTKKHLSVVEKVANRKINILLEKPVAPTYEEASKIKNIIENNKIKCVVGHIERYNPAVKKAIDLIINGDLGKILYIDFIRQGPNPNAEVDVDILTDLGIHDLEIFNYIMKNICDSIKEKYVINKKNVNDFFDLSRVIIKTYSDIAVTFCVDRLTPRKTRKVFVSGTKAAIELDYINQDLIMFYNGFVEKDYSYESVLMGISVGKEVKLKIKKQEPLFLEISNFINVIKGIDEPYVNIDDAVEAVKLLNIILGD